MAQQSAIEAVLTAAYTALNVASMTALATGGVHNGLPQTVTYPFVRIGDATETREDCMGQPGKDVLVRVHVFNQARSDLVLSRIVSKAIELLHYAALAVAGHVLVCSQYQQAYPGGTENINGVEVRHHVAEFLVTVRQTL
jgi:hypothetical protein